MVVCYRYFVRAGQSALDYHRIQDRHQPVVWPGLPPDMCGDAAESLGSREIVSGSCIGIGDYSHLHRWGEGEDKTNPGAPAAVLPV